jgi:class 3 adenylate cyclase
MGRRPWWAWLCAAGAITLLCWPLWVNPLTDITTATWDLAVLSLVVAGWVAMARPSQRGNGILMLVIALTLSATTLQYVAGGPWAFIGTILYPFSGVLLGWLVLRWPHRRLQTRPQFWLIRTSFILILLLAALANVTWEPRWSGYKGPIWWPTLVHSEDLGIWVYNGTQIFEGVLLAAFVVLMVQRVLQATRPERRELIPVAIAAITFAVFDGAQVIGAVTGADVSALTNWSSNLTALAIPVSFLLGIGIRRVQRALAVEALLDPQRLTSADAVSQALGRALGDRQLTLATWSAERGQYLMADGTVAAADSDGRHTVYVASPVDGSALARIAVAPKLAGRTDFVEAVLRAAGVALDNARLQAELRAGQRDARQSLQRLDHAAATHRRMTRLLPGGLAERISADPEAFTGTELLTVTVLISDIRGYTAIAEAAQPARLAAQLNEHRQAMNDAILAHDGTVMQYVGDAVLAVFGAPEPLADHEARALAAAARMHVSQDALNMDWADQGLPPFGLGIGLSTGQVAAALLGSPDRVEYTVVGDTVNLAARLCDAARPAGSTVASAATVRPSERADGFELLPALHVKGRASTVAAYRRSPARPDVVRPGLSATPAGSDRRAGGS